MADPSNPHGRERKQRTPEDDPATLITGNSADAEDPFLKEQLEALRFFEEKRKREAEDAQMAAQLSKLQVDSPAVAKKKPTAESDLELARRLNEEEQSASRKKAQEADELYARQLGEEEEKKRKEHERRELMQTMEDIRRAARAQAETELAKLRQEKQQLEMQVERAEAESGRGTIELQGVVYPAYWKPQTNNQAVFDVEENSDEWKWVSGRFREGLQNRIHKIERNQNKELWMWYWLKRKQLQTKNSSGANEKYVFHGSRNGAYDIILKDGFDHRVAHMGGAIGAGVYFAHSSTTSSSYVSASGSHYKRMLFCYVSVGEIGVGAVGLTRPPQKKKNFISSMFTGSGADEVELYDSVGTEGSVYVVFDRTQAYPGYIIYYQ